MNITQNQMKKIYQKYMTLPVDEINVFLNESSIKYNCTIVGLKEEIENCAKRLGVEEYQKYKKRRIRIRYSSYKYVRYILDLLNKIEKKEEINFKSLDKRIFSKEVFDKCINTFPDKKILLEELYNQINDYINNQKCEVLEIFDPSYKNNEFQSKYIIEITNILNCKTEEEAITYMRNAQLTEKAFKSMINKFKAKCLNSDKYIPRLEYLFNKYQEFVSSNSDELKNIYNSRKEHFEYNVQIVNRVINSGYSIEEFCHYNLGFDIKQIEKSIKIVFDYKKTDINLLKENSSQNFINQIKNIVLKIEKGNYDNIDYYMDTKLSFRDFQIVTKKYGIYNSLVAIFIASNLKNDIAINRENELNNKLIIKDRSITDIEKQEIFAFLEENQIPISMRTYKTAINKYLNNEIDIETKKYIKK